MPILMVCAGAAVAPRPSAQATAAASQILRLLDIRSPPRTVADASDLVGLLLNSTPKRGDAQISREECWAASVGERFPKPRHRERSEAIQKHVTPLDRVVSYASSR